MVEYNKAHSSNVEVKKEKKEQIHEKNEEGNVMNLDKGERLVLERSELRKRSKKL